MRAWMLGGAFLVGFAAVSLASAQSPLAVKNDSKRLDDILSGWAKKSSSMRDMQCEFQRITTDNIFKTQTVEIGRASGIKPYTGRLDLMDENGKFTQIFIYTGKELHQYDFKFKQESVYLLPDPEPSAGKTMPGPLILVYGMTVPEAKARFDLKMVREFARNGVEYAELHATPKTPMDQQEFKLAKIVIDAKTFLPKELFIEEPNGNTQHWIFNSAATNLNPPIPANSPDYAPLKIPSDWKKLPPRKYGDGPAPADQPKTKSAASSKNGPDPARPAAPKR